jgi:D-glycero-D-manno-heptose 1,7-bisphosphate phosphatase
MSQQLVLLAGGLGSRLGKLTSQIPKPLIRIGKKSIIEIVIEHYLEQGIKKIVVLVSYKKEKIIKVLKKKFFDTNISFIKEKKLLGTGGALRLARNKLDKKFFLANSDTYFKVNLKKIKELVNKKKFIIILSLIKASTKGKLSNLRLKKGKVLFSKKNINLKNAGVYYVNKKIIKYIKKGDSSLEEDVISRLIKKGYVIGKKFPNNNFIDIGTKKDLNLAKKLIPLWQKNKVVFFDRDGVLNKNTGYVHKSKDFIWLNGAKKAIKYLNNNNYKIIIITNQSGIGRGYYKEKNVVALHQWINKDLKKIKAKIDDFYFCPFHCKYGIGKYKQRSFDRKPNPGMIFKAIKKWNVNKEKSFMVGDSLSDKIAAKRANIKFFYKKNYSLLKQVKEILPYNEI